MSAIYPWEALEEALRPRYTRGKYRDEHGGALSPGELAMAILSDLEDAGWRVVKDSAQ